MSGIEDLEEFAKGGPYIGPKGGKYADPQHKIPWKDGKEKEKQGKYKDVFAGIVAEAHAGDINIGKTMTRISGSGDNHFYLAKHGVSDKMGRKLSELDYIKKHPSIPDAWVITESGKAIATKYSSIKRSMADSDMSGIEDLNEFVKAQAMPTGNPKKKLGEGEEQGGKLAGVGATSGSGDSGDKPVGAPAPVVSIVSEDEEEDEKALKEHKKPIEKTAKSIRYIDTSPQAQRDMVAKENATLANKLRKGDPDVIISDGIPAPAQAAPEEMVKARTWNQGPDSHVTYSNEADQAIDRLMKSDEDFYSMGERPSLTPLHGIVGQITCSSCGDKMSKALTACPSCGAGSVTPRIDTGVYEEPQDLNKSRPGLLRRRKGLDDIIIADDE